MWTEGAAAPASWNDEASAVLRAVHRDLHRQAARTVLNKMLRDYLDYTLLTPTEIMSNYGYFMDLHNDAGDVNSNQTFGVSLAGRTMAGNSSGSVTFRLAWGPGALQAARVTAARRRRGHFMVWADRI